MPPKFRRDPAGASKQYEQVIVSYLQSADAMKQVFDTVSPCVGVSLNSSVTVNGTHCLCRL